MLTDGVIRVWFESYLSTYLERDVLDLVRIEHADLYVRLIRLLAGRTGQMLNLTAISLGNDIFAVPLTVLAGGR